MGTSMKVTSVEAILDFRVSLIKFHDRIDKALGEVEMELRRFMNWLEREQVAYWQHQLRRWREEVSQAKNALQRKKLSGGKGSTPDITEEKAALRKAQNRMEICEQKIQLIKRWLIEANRGIEEYHGQARQLADLVEGDPAPAVAFMSRVVDDLEKYLATNAPTNEPVSTSTAESAEGAEAVGAAVGETEAASVSAEDANAAEDAKDSSEEPGAASTDEGAEKQGD